MKIIQTILKDKLIKMIRQKKGHQRVEVQDYTLINKKRIQGYKGTKNKGLL